MITILLFWWLNPFVFPQSHQFAKSYCSQKTFSSPQAPLSSTSFLNLRELFVLISYESPPVFAPYQKPLWILTSELSSVLPWHSCWSWLLEQYLLLVHLQLHSKSSGAGCLTLPPLGRTCRQGVVTGLRCCHFHCCQLGPARVAIELGC